MRLGQPGLTLPIKGLQSIPLRGYYNENQDAIFVYKIQAGTGVCITIHSV